MKDIVEKVHTTEVFTLRTKDLDLHPVAKTTPRMSDDGYNALKLDIELNGQQDPVLLYRGRIIDGRHRWLILTELEVDTILAIKLPHNTTAQEMKIIARSKELRRHETPAQLAVTAYYMMLESPTKLSAVEAAGLSGADRRFIGYAKSISEKFKRPDILKLIFDGQKLDIGTEYDPNKTDSLAAILNWLKEFHKTANKRETRGKVEMTEEQFIECAKHTQELIGLDMRMIKHIASKLYSHVKDYENDTAKAEEQLDEA